MTVEAVTAGSEAERAGLQGGDTILEINGRVAGQESSEAIAGLAAGDTITVRVRSRRSAERELKWKVGGREEITYELKDMDDISAEQHARRTAWLKGEAQSLPASSSH
jgi:predicted metalloprotease with PDZ domain